MNQEKPVWASHSKFQQQEEPVWAVSVNWFELVTASFNNQETTSLS